MIHKITVSGFSLLAGILSSQLCLYSVEKDILVLDDAKAVAMAKERSRSVLSAYEDIARAEGEARQVTSPFMPQVTTGANYYLRNEVTDSILGERDNYQWQANIAANQHLFGFGSRSGASGVARSLRESALYNHVLAQLSSVKLIRGNLADVRLRRADVVVNLERVQQRKNELQDAENRFAAGSVSRIDVNQSKIQLSQAEIALEAAENAEVVALQTTIRLLALEYIGQASRVQIEGELEQISEIEDLYKAAAEFVDQGHQLLLIDATISGQQSEEKRARGDQLPQIFAAAAAFDDSSDNDFTTNDWQIGLNLSWSIYGGGREGAARDAARAAQRSLSQDRLAVLEERQTRLAQARSLLDSLEQRIARQRETVVLASENYEDTLELYRAGLETLTRVNESNLQVNEAKFALNQLLYQQHLVAVELYDIAEDLD